MRRACAVVSMPLCIAATEGTKVAAGFSSRPTGLQIGLTAAVIVLSGMLTGWASQPTTARFKKNPTNFAISETSRLSAVRLPVR
jgi:hypothetical protein